MLPTVLIAAATVVGLSIAAGIVWGLRSSDRAETGVHGGSPVAATVAACLAWAGFFLPWVIFGEVAVLGWDTFVRVGDMELPSWPLAAGAAVALLAHWLRAVVAPRVLAAVGTLAAACGVAQSILVAFGIAGLNGATLGAGCFLTLVGFVALLSLSAAAAVSGTGTKGGAAG